MAAGDQRGHNMEVVPVEFLSRAFDIRPAPHAGLPLEVQRKKWVYEFLKTYAVLIIAYGGFYLLRTNFKSAQPFLVEQTGLTTSDLGYIGFGFSLTYGSWGSSSTGRTRRKSSRHCSSARASPRSSSERSWPR